MSWRGAHGTGVRPRGLTRGLTRRTVVLRLDETFILETPPLRAGWAKVGVQAKGPITGNHARRVIHGALNVTSGHVECLITDHWTAATSQGPSGATCAGPGGAGPWSSSSTAAPPTRPGPVEPSRLPTATPELNACAGGWRGAKSSGLAHRASQAIDEAAEAACHCWLALTPRQRLQLAGVLSGHFWLAT